jgi:protein gp37
MGDTKIEWTERTWNPIRGCSIVSPGCTNCYAMKQAHRFSGEGQAYEGLTKLTKGGPVWTGAVKMAPDHLKDPLRWRRPSRIFVNSMSDLFHEALPDEFIDMVFAVMAGAHDHTFQVLTKRPERMRAYLQQVSAEKDMQRWISAAEEMNLPGDVIGWIEREADWPLPNVWLGVSVEDQARADERIPLLLETPAAVRWLSCEPLLGPVSFEGRWVPYEISAIHENWLKRLGWIVVGGESGPGARPMDLDWARSLRAQCAAIGVPFFMKQIIDGHRKVPYEEWPSDLRVREYPK